MSFHLISFLYDFAATRMKWHDAKHAARLTIDVDGKVMRAAMPALLLIFQAP